MNLGQLLINGHVTAVSMLEGPKPASLSECPANPLEISARYQFFENRNMNCNKKILGSTKSVWMVKINSIFSTNRSVMITTIRHKRCGLIKVIRK